MSLELPLTEAQRQALLQDLLQAGVTDVLTEDHTSWQPVPVPASVPQTQPTPLEQPVAIAKPTATQSKPKAPAKPKPQSVAASTEPAHIWQVGQGTRLTIITGAEYALQDSPYPFASEELALLEKMLGALKISLTDTTKIAVAVTDAQGGMLAPQSLQAATEKLNTMVAATQGPLLLFGQKVAQLLLPQQQGTLQQLRQGNLHTVANRSACVSYHPRLLLKQAAYKRPAWDDLQKMMPVLS